MSDSALCFVPKQMAYLLEQFNFISEGEKGAEQVKGSESVCQQKSIKILNF